MNSVLVDSESIMRMKHIVLLYWRQCVVVFSPKRISNYRSGRVFNWMFLWRSYTLLVELSIATSTTSVFGSNFSRVVLKMYFLTISI